MRRLTAVWVWACLVLMFGSAAKAAPIVYDVVDNNNAWSIALPPGNSGPVPSDTSFGDVIGSDVNQANVTQNDWSGSAQFEDNVFKTTGSVMFSNGGPTTLDPDITHILLQFFVGGTGLYVPDVDVYFMTADTESVIWSYNLTSIYAPVAGWNTYSVALGDPGWSDTYGANATGTFATDLLTGITQVGVHIIYDDSQLGTQLYQIKDLGYGHEVPEPGTYMLLSTALMSLGYTLARRRRAEKKA